MTTTIWILKGVIAMIFTFTGIYKLFLTKEKLLDNGMKGLIDLNEKQIKLVGILEVLGTLGLLLPSLLNIFPVLSIISALCLSLTMIVAGWIHYKQKLPIFPNIAIFGICILLAYLEIKQF